MCIDSNLINRRLGAAGYQLLNHGGVIEQPIGLDFFGSLCRGEACVDEIEPGDGRRTADALVAVDVDLVARARERLGDDVHGLPHELGQHETSITDVKVV